MWVMLCTRVILASWQVGFGEAGAEVIADNIKSGGDLNPMVPGRRVMAVFGFCDIRQFTGEDRAGQGPQVARNPSADLPYPSLL